MSRLPGIGCGFRIPCLVLCLLSGFALTLLAAHTAPVPQPASAATDTPERKAPAARSETTLMVVTLCPGQSASTIESRVTSHMERWLQRAPGAYQVESRSLPGVSMVRVTFRAGTDPRHAQAATMSLVMAAWPDWPDLPAGTQPPLVLPVDPTVTRPVGMVALSIPGKSLILQRDMARLELCGMLGSVPGVLAPVVLGGADRIMRVDLDPVKLVARGLSPLDVVTAVYRANLPVPVVPITIGKLQLRLEAPVKSRKQLADVVVRSQPGPEVRLRDLGTLKDAAAPQTSQLRVNGTAMVAVPIYAQPGYNAAAVREAVRKALPAMQAKFQAAEGKLVFLAFGGKEQGNWLAVRVRAISGLRFDLVEKRIVQVERFLQAFIPAKERIGTITDLGLRHDLSAAFTQNTAEQDATIHVQLTGKGPLSAQAYAARLRSLLKEEKRFADLQFAIVAGAEVPIDILITGQRVANEKLIEQIRKRVARVEGAVDAQFIQRVDGPSLAIQVDYQKAKQLGFDNPNLALQAAASLGCIVPKNNSTSIMVTFGPAEAKTLEDVYNVPLRSGNSYVLVKELATLRQVPVEVQIDRINRMRVYTVRALADGRPARAVAQDIEKALQGLTLPAKVKVQVKLR